MSKKYTYPSPRVVTEAGSLVVIKFAIDFANQRMSLAYRELNANGDIVSSPITTLDDLARADQFAQAATGLPGTTFEEKLLAPAVLRNILPFVPDGGTVEDR